MIFNYWFENIINQVSDIVQFGFLNKIPKAEIFTAVSFPRVRRVEIFKYPDQEENEI